jgi:hypothetical protein
VVAIATATRHVRPGTGRFVALWRSRPGLAALIVIAAVAICPTSALADGDPASDVLATQSLFLPADAGLPAARQRQLVSLLGAARARGLSLRVAMIASPTDLASGHPLPVPSAVGAPRAGTGSGDPVAWIVFAADRDRRRVDAQPAGSPASGDQQEGPDVVRPGRRADMML